MVTKVNGNSTSTFGGDVDVTGNVITDAPAFRAALSADQSITTATATKIQFNTEIFDTNSDYDNSTNYRFTPTVAGYYQVSATMRAEGSSLSLIALYIYKNGSNDLLLELDTKSTSTTHLAGSTLIYMNGSTDYIEIYGRIDGTSPKFGGNATLNNASFSGFLARAT